MLSGHFYNGVCKNAPCLLQITGKLDNNGKTARGALDGSIKSERNQ